MNGLREAEGFKMWGRQWGLGAYNTNLSQAAFAVLLTKHLACPHDFILMQCCSGHIHV